MGKTAYLSCRMMMMLGSGIDPFLGFRIVLAAYLFLILCQKTERLWREY